MNGMSETRPLDALTFPLWGSRLIEASAGTGKTYTIAALYLRLVLGHGELVNEQPLTPPDILVMTFTRAATQELRDRIRSRLTEAAAFFLEQNPGDAFLHALRSDYDPPQWSGCARRLQLAAEWMDEAAIFTIDSWSYRMLREHAFKSSGHFDVEMDIADAQNLAEAARDYWRLFIAPLAANQFATAMSVLASHGIKEGQGVCDDLAQLMQQQWLRSEYDYPPGTPPAETCEKIATHIAELKAHWAPWLAEISELLQEAHTADSYVKKKLDVRVWRGCLAALEEWVNSPAQLYPGKMDKIGLLSHAYLASIWKKGEPPQHPGLHAIPQLQSALAAIPGEADGILHHMANWISERVDALRRKRGTLGVSGLQQQLGRALRGPGGEELAMAIRRQFPVALIDEFQDTSPLQYGLFDAIYNVSENSEESLLALIGDPKQAIYGFRGADIHSYLEAREACSGRLYSLPNNYRSSREMVSAVNAIFELAESQNDSGAFLFRSEEGDNPVPFVPVTAATNPGVLEVDTQAVPALTVWSDVSFRTVKDCQSALAQSCASEIHRLLELGESARAGIRCNGEFRSLKARDFAVLVNTRGEADALRAALSERGIRSVYLSESTSVYHSPAAQEVLAWIRACAEPERAGLVRAALATPALGLSWPRLEALIHDDRRWEAVLEQFASYKEHWRRKGVLPMLRRLMQDFDVPARMLSDDDERREGERMLTDYLHLAELLQAASVSLDGEHALIRFFEEGMERGGGVDIDGDVSRMRLESDADLVQVVTVHKSKGLEYPLVFYPFAYYAPQAVTRVKLPVVYRDQRGEQQWVTSHAELTPEVEHEALRYKTHEMEAESVRKFYVAMTRARYATWIGVASLGSLPRSAPGKLLGDAALCSADRLLEGLESWAVASPHIAVTPFPEHTSGRYRSKANSPVRPAWRVMNRRIFQRWSLSSYSALAKMAVGRPEPTLNVAATMGMPALPDEPRLDTFFEAYASAEDEMIEAETGGLSRPEAEAGGIHGFPRGAGPGSFLHGMLEWVFRQGPDSALKDEAALRAWIERRSRSRGWQEYAESLGDWLLDFCSCEFNLAGVVQPSSGPLRLRDLQTFIPEMEFWFGVRDTDLPKLDEAVSAQFLPGLARPRLTEGRFNGMLRGFIDLVFEHEGRFYVADYKSNWLGHDASSYKPARIATAVLEHRYDLQSALYLYALHKHLRARLGDSYDYEQHIGGALIFFVRGHEGPGQGLHFAKPPHKTMVELERIFDAYESDVTCMEPDGASS